MATRRKAKATPKEFNDVTAETGKLKGMTFTVVGVVKPSDSYAEVRYRAPSDGPVGIVRLLAGADGKFPESATAAAVISHFERLLAGSVAWSKENGYYEPTTNIKLIWNRQLARFTVKENNNEESTE